MRRKPHSRVWGRHSPTSFPRGAKPQNCGFWHRGRNLLSVSRRLPCSGFSVHRANRAGLPARCAWPFSFSPKIHLKGRQLPAGREFFKFSFASVIRERGFWQPAGQRNFPFTPYTTAFEICQTGQAAFFWLHLPTTGDFAILPNGQQKKAANLFQTYCFHWPPVFSFQ